LFQHVISPVAVQKETWRDWRASPWSVGEGRVWCGAGRWTSRDGEAWRRRS